MFVYGATITKDDEGYFAQFVDIEAAYADGSTYQEVVKAAAETLQLVVATYLDEGIPLPQATFHQSSSQTIFAVEVTPRFIEETKCITLSQAAKELSVSQGRITQLISAGKLVDRYFDGVRMVSIESVNDYKASPRKAGRPRKAFACQGTYS